MRTAKQVALCWTISLFLLPVLGFGADNPASPPLSGVKQAEICFPLPDGERILHVLESMTACQEVVKAGEDALASADARAQALESRVVEQDGELKEARKVIDDTRHAGEEAAKAAAPPWYQRVLNASRWIVAGAVIGYVAAKSGK
jgi:hypothetical protein